MRVLVVYGHPVEGSYASALRDRVLRGLDAAGHDVDLLDLYAEGFDPVLTLGEHRSQAVADEPRLAEHLARLRRAEVLVMVHPTWWSGPPAMVKGWYDRVWADEVAFTPPPGAERIHPRLHNVRRIVVVTTHGSSKLMNALEGEAGKHMVSRPLRLACRRLTRVRWVAFYGIDTSTQEQRERFLGRAERAMAKL